MNDATYGDLSGLKPDLRPDEEALMNRLHRYFRTAYRSLPKQNQIEVLSAKDDFWTAVNLLAHAPMEETAEFKVRLRGAIARRELLASDGGVISPASAAELLGISRQAVGQRRAAGKLLAVEAGRGYVYPVWQFDGPHLLDGIPETLEILKNEDPWARFTFFLSKDAAAGGKRPLDLLRKKKKTPVLRAARLQGMHGAV